VIIKVMGISDLTTESASNEKNTKIPNLKNKEKTRPKATTEQFVNNDRSCNHKHVQEPSTATGQVLTMDHLL
jgi:hypothetical protein